MNTAMLQCQTRAGMLRNFTNSPAMRPLIRVARLTVLAMGLVGAPGLAQADTIYTTMGPNNNDWLANSNYLIVAGISSSTKVSFVASENASVTDIGVGLVNYADSNPASVTISLYSSTDGKPGTVMGSWTHAMLYPGSATIATIDAISGINLVGGTTYWLGINDPNSYSGWGYASIGSGTGTAYINGSLYTLNPDAAFYLLGNSTPVGSSTSVPEPGSIAILGAGLLGLTAFVRNRRKV